MSEEQEALPSGLSPENIGKVVTVQVIRRAESKGDSLLLETLQKHTGVLEAYSSSARWIGVKLKGLDFSMSARRNYVVEVYVKE